MSQRQPTPEQARAITSRAGRILLEAGAGSGKTTVLVDRYCDRIELDGLGPEEILAFTFTDKAAAQMGERIRTELMRRAAASANADDSRRLREASHRLSAAWVMTMHAFCRRVLASHPVAAGLDPGFTIFQGAHSARLKRQAFDLAFKAFIDEANDEAPAELAAAYGIEPLRELVAAIHAKLRNQGQLNPRLPDCPVVDAEATLVEMRSQGIRTLDAIGQGHKAAPAVASLIELATELIELSDRATTEAWEEKLAALEALKIPGRSPTAELESCRKLTVKSLLSAGPGTIAYRQIARLLELFDQTYDALKAARSGLDFDDLQLRAARLLNENAAIGEAFRSRFREIMVDEFQDTSAGQVLLISALRGPETSLFQVGDEFQSIYRFRDADLETFRSERHQMREDSAAQILPLRGNFRSKAEILAAANRFTSELIPSFSGLTIGSLSQLEPPATGPPAEALVEILVCSPDGWEDAHNRPYQVQGETIKRSAEAEALAERLAALAAAGVPRSDMVVLIRAHSNATAYVEALERKGLYPFVVGGRGFWLGREVADAIALLRAVANPLDDEGLFGALASAACAVNPDTLWLLRRAAGNRDPIWPVLARYFSGRYPGLPTLDRDARRWLDQIDADDRERLNAFYGVLRELREASELLGLGELLELAFTKTGLDLATLRASEGDRRWAGLRKLVRIAEEYEAAEGRDLRGLLDHGELAREIDDDSEAVIAAEGHDGVRLMTVHAAKGLEFPVVAVPELGRNSARVSTGPESDLRLRRNEDGSWQVGLRLRRIGAKSVPVFDCDEIAAAEKRADAEEEMRLFYVAMTRAEQRLILSGVGPNGPIDELKETTPILHRLLATFPVEDGEIRLPPAPPREGLEAEPPPGRVSVRPYEPRAEADPDLDQRQLLPDQTGGAGEAAGETDPASDGSARDGTARRRLIPRPPIDPIQVESPLPSLSFSALKGSEEAGKELIAVEELRSSAGADELDPDEAPGWADPPHPDDQLAEGETLATAFGGATHLLLEHSLGRGRGRAWLAPNTEQAASALAEYGLAPTEDRLSALMRLASAWTDSELCRELAAPTTSLRVEVPLTLNPATHPEATIHGFIDLLAAPVRKSPLILDFKTNRLRGRRPEALAADYHLQAQIYALAVSRALNADTVEFAFVFLEQADEPVRLRFSAAELTVAEAEIGARVEQFRSAWAD